METVFPFLCECVSETHSQSATLKQHLSDVLCLLELQLVFYFCNVVFQMFLLAQVGYLRTYALVQVLAHLLAQALAQVHEYLRTWAPAQLRKHFRMHLCTCIHVK